MGEQVKMNESIKTFMILELVHFIKFPFYEG